MHRTKRVHGERRRAAPRARGFRPTRLAPLAALLLALAPPPLVAEPSPPLRILLLNSWHSAMPWQIDFERGLRDELRRGSRPFELYAEYLDAGRFPERPQQQALLRFLQEKYRQTPIDVTIAESGPASALLTEHPELLTTSDRIHVLSGDKAAIDLRRTTTDGAIIPIVDDFGGAIDEMMRLAAPRKVYIVADTSEPSGAERLKAFDRAWHAKRRRVTVEYLTNLPMERLTERVADLPPRSAIFYLLIFRDGAGQRFIPFEAVRRLAAAANAPTFSNWESLLGSGIVGGYLLSGERVGRIAARAIESPPTGAEATANGYGYGYAYDWRQLRRWGFDHDALPRGAELRHYQPSLFEAYRWQIIATVITLAFLAALSSFLWTINRKLATARAELRRERQQLESRVTERTRELQRSETQFRALFETSSDAILLLEPRGRIVDCNEAALTTFGVPDKASLVGLDPVILSPPRQADDRPTEEVARERMERIQRDGSALFEWIHWRHDSRRPFIAEVLLNTIETGGRTLIQASVRDISARKQFEQALTQAKEAAESASRAKSEFLANMSHEIRTPMNGVIGMLELLAGTRLDAEQRHYLDTATRSAEMQLNVINDVLDLSKIEAGKLELERAEFEPGTLIHDVAELIAAPALNKGLELVTHCDPALRGPLLGDSLRLRQVLLNLAGNAVKFTRHGMIELRAERRAAEGDRVRLRLTVRDTGIGIEPSVLQRLFQPFTQGDTTTTRHYGGSGLGLAISRRLVELMGGDIQADSTPGEGSAFHVELSLPVAEDRPSAVARPQPPSPPAAPPAPRVEALRGRVLLTEDNLVNVQVAEGLLRRLQLTVEVAYTGRQAVEMSADGDYDLILMDIQMPEMDGFAATEAIRRREREGGGPRTPIVAMTAHALSGDREQCFRAGMDDYLIKPVRWAAFAATLARWLPAAGPIVEEAKPAPPTAPPDGGGDAPIDPATLDELRANLSAVPGGFERVLEEFRASARQLLKQADEAIRNDDAKALLLPVHSLKSAAATVGALPLSATAKRLETMAREGDLGDAADQHAEATRRLAAALDALDRLA